MKLIKKSKAAFTLVELAIVIVIIGLLVGGVLQGQELIKQAKLRSFYAEHTGYMAGISTFYAKYNSLPGDTKDGFKFFGGDDCLDIAIGYTNMGCNGNGNKVYELDREGLLFWKHLSKAKIIKGYYTGATTGEVGTNECCVKAGVNSPASKLTNGAYWLRVTNVAAYGDSNIPTPARTYVSSVNHFRYGLVKVGNSTNNWPAFEIMSQMDAFEFDLKFDDGKAASGNIIGLNGSEFNNCWDGTTYEYRTSATTGGCSFILPFFSSY
jgi:prepilin-type N-terminal cleavage/methylation domain-containing protein